MGPKISRYSYPGPFVEPNVLYLWILYHQDMCKESWFKETWKKLSRGVIYAPLIREISQTVKPSHWNGNKLPVYTTSNNVERKKKKILILTVTRGVLNFKQQIIDFYLTPLFLSWLRVRTRLLDVPKDKHRTLPLQLISHKLGVIRYKEAILWEEIWTTCYTIGKDV